MPGARSRVASDPELNPDEYLNQDIKTNPLAPQRLGNWAAIIGQSARRPEAAKLPCTHPELLPRVRAAVCGPRSTIICCKPLPVESLFGSG